MHMSTSRRLRRAHQLGIPTSRAFIAREVGTFLPESLLRIHLLLHDLEIFFRDRLIRIKLQGMLEVRFRFR